MTIDDTARSAWEWRRKALFQLGRGPEAIRALVPAHAFSVQLLADIGLALPSPVASPQNDR